MTFKEYLDREKIVKNNSRLRRILKIPLEERTKIDENFSLENICNGEFTLDLVGRQYCFSKRISCSIN